MINIQKNFNEKYCEISKIINNYNKETMNIDNVFKMFNEMKNYYIETNHALTTYDKQLYREVST